MIKAPMAHVALLLSGRGQSTRASRVRHHVALAASPHS